MKRFTLFLSMLCLIGFAITPVRAQDMGPESIPFDFSIVPGFSIGGMVRTGSDVPRVDGVAVGMFAGRTDGLNGVALASLWNTSTDDVRGAQFSGVLNTAQGRLNGGQFAGVLNTVRGHLVGVQSAGVANLANSFKGMQVAGVANTAGEVEGSQIAGVVNVAGDVRGSQIAGVLNIARKVRGLQLGVINISESNTGAPIGLFSYVRDTGLEYEVFADETGFVHTGIRSGSKAFSSYLAFGARAGTNEEYRWAAAAGFGWRVDVGPRGYGMIDGISRSVWNEDFGRDPGFVQTLRLGIGYHLSPWFSVYGAPTMNWFYGERNDGKAFAPWSVYDASTSKHHHRLWPGFTFGFRVHGKARY